MRFTHILAAFAVIFAAAACSFTEIDDVQSAPEQSSQYLEVVGRIAQYSDCDVATRSKKEGDESKVTSMGLALFPINDNGTIGNCLYYDFELGGSIVFIVDRHDEVFNNYVGEPFAMYIFANMQDAAGFPKTSEAGVGKSLEYFTKCAAAANDKVKEIPENGFPMVGSLGNTVSTNDKDGIELILKPAQTDANVDGLPLVDGSPTDNLEIPLKSMYAKFSFTISVKPDQEIVGNKAPRFDLTSYAVNNIAETVDSDSSTNYDDDVIDSSGDVIMGSYAQGATTAEFYFYLPERYLSPSKNIDDVLPAALKKGTYDETVDADGNGYRDAEEKYHQRFKNLLTDGKAATYVTIKGKYTDHHENTYDVDYNIYLGGNNYDDFNIIRNTHYENSVTIRGISASDDQAVNTWAISIDWRVNVARSTPLVIGLRRESLLDAHFEVRPLRLRLVGENIPTGTSATVQILKEDGTATDIPGWVRMEESGSTTDHITADGVSQGKRKYFTTNLVTETLASTGQTIILNNLDRSNKTVWIYVDENPTTTSRAALLRVTYDDDIKDFTIVQNGLYKVTGADSGRDYYIEQYEEYLYNYDAEDSYGQTKQEGMPWGLDDVQLSNEHDSFYIDEDNTDWNDYVKNNSLLKYDFYIAKYDSFVTEGVTVHGFAGQHFTSEIFDATKNNTDDNKKVNVLTMADQPKGAVEYCYNRNKRDADGNVVKVEWYLPSADELEDFIVPAYSTFEEFQNNYYWTSQPAYIRDAFYYEYATGRNKGSSVRDAYAFVAYEENKQYARATKVVSKGNNVYEYALSGLNKIPTDAHLHESFPNEQLLGDSYFTNMHAWYRWNGNTQKEQKQADEHFNEKRNSSETGVRYYVPIGHSYDKMYQKDGNGEHGYHPRTKSNRVRCARRDWNPDKNYEMEIVYIVSTTPATTLDKSGNTKYVIRNAAYPSTSLTTSESNVAATSSSLGINNYVVIEGNKIKSVAKNENQYFDGYDGNVSFSNSGTSYTISNSGANFTISYSRWTLFNGTTYYYLKQTDNDSVSMSTGNSGNLTWQFYEVKKEYKVVE